MLCLSVRKDEIMNFCRNILSSPATKTLWKNPNPNSNFGAQTIAFDFSRVDFEKSEVILKFKRKSTDMKTIEIRLNDGENEVCVGSSSYFFWRKYTLSKTGLVVDTGGYTSTYPEIKSDNSCAIPVELKIRGGGGSLYYKLFKNPFVKGFSACRQSGKRWNLMGSAEISCREEVKLHFLQDINLKPESSQKAVLPHFQFHQGVYL